MSEIRITDPTTGGQKGQKPERFDLIPWDALQEVARVYGKGAEKYEPNNWLRGYKWSLSFGALLRHVTQFWLGKEYDDGPGGTGCRHLACAAFHCLALMTFSMRKLGTDDRVKVSNPSVPSEAARFDIAAEKLPAPLWFETDPFGRQ